MRRTIPTQLILFAVLVALGVTGWIYIYSCRDKVVMELQTITGDASCLSDKALDIRIITETQTSSVNIGKLVIGLFSGPTLTGIDYENVLQPNYHDELLVYFDSSGEVQSKNNGNTFSLKFNELSGKWVVTDYSGVSVAEAASIEYSSHIPKVFGVYEVKDKSAIVLLTIDDKTELYATVYDTETKTNQDPVLIFKSDSGEISPQICRKNNTCPLGSILVEVQNDTKEYFAVALEKNEMNGNVEPVSYDVSQIISTDSYLFLDSTDKLDYNDSYSEIFYRDEEVWIISDITDEIDRSSSVGIDYFPVTFLTDDKNSTTTDRLTLDTPNFPYSSQSARHINIKGYKDGVIFYEGLLSIDLTFANLEEQLVIASDVSYWISSYNFRTWIDFY